MAAPATSFRAAYAKYLLHEHLLTKLNDETVPEKTFDALPRLALPSQGRYRDDDRFQGRICIVGAGATGLYLAMMLKYLGITDVDILEASNRVGGRCYTQKLHGKDEFHNYYDVGAMRIPEVPWMRSTLSFIKHLGIKPVDYVFDNANAPCCYWYEHKAVDNKKFDDFMEPIKTEFIADFNVALSNWLDNTNKDNYSTRSWLMNAPEIIGGPKVPWSYGETANAELGDSSTGLFDQSFTETVIDYVDFNSGSSTKWWRLEGGMQAMTDTMREHLKSTSWPEAGSASIEVSLNSPVTSLADSRADSKISVTVAGQEPVKYDMVFNTTAMGPLQRMDIADLELPREVLTGIRSLGYDRATKVAIRFSKAWWNMDGSSIFGGVSGSDLPISNVVYPSWNDGPDAPAVLMVSYAWAQDATRMGALIPDYNVVEPSIDDPVVTVCLQSLARLWSASKSDHNPPLTFEYLRSLYMTHHAFAWSHDQYTGGAFALFGPGQFKNIYPEFNKLFCNGKFAMAGEALSAHHAWICGSFDSAYMKLIMFLTSRGRVNDVEILKRSIFGGGKDKNPEEMEMGLTNWCVLLGEGGGPAGWGEGFPWRGQSATNGVNGSK